MRYETFSKKKATESLLVMVISINQRRTWRIMTEDKPFKRYRIVIDGVNTFSEREAVDIIEMALDNAGVPYNRVESENITVVKKKVTL
jgi:hypothetical protein